MIDGLSWGGSQRWVWDLVRLSSPPAYKHWVIAIFPDSGDFVYAKPLEEVGVYGNWREPSILRWIRSAINQPVFQSKLVPVRKLLSLLWLVGCYGAACLRIASGVLRFRPHVIHSHTFYGFMAGLAVKLLFRKPLVHTVPALMSQMIDAGVPWLPGAYRRFHNSVDSFVTGASVDELIGLGVSERKILEIKGVVDLAAIDVAYGNRSRHRSSIRRSLSLDDDAVLVLSVGRLHRSKGHAFSVEALPLMREGCKNLHWVLLGEGEEREKLERRLEELGMQEHAHLLGFQADPLPYYAAADLYLRTTILEAENLCSYQAMAMGLPVVGFDTGVATELIPQAGHGILVPNKNVRDLARAVVSLLGDPIRADAMRDCGRRYSGACLGIQGTIDAICRIYRSLSC